MSFGHSTNFPQSTPILEQILRDISSPKERQVAPPAAADFFAICLSVLATFMVDHNNLRDWMEYKYETEVKSVHCAKQRPGLDGKY